MSYYTIEQIKERRAEQIRLGFDIPEAYARATDEQIAAHANGVGPDAFPSSVRGLLTEVVPHLDLAADIHDVEFRLSDGRTASFLAANARIYHNGRLWILANRGRFNPRRYIELWRVAKDLQILNGAQGWDAWAGAHERYQGAPL